jgi:ubiquinone/menaquinone biosynthesis C-methylase UbiE
MTTQQEIKTEVRRRYGAAAKKAQQGGCCAAPEESVVTSNLYTTDEIQHLPAEAVTASLGCGNPVAVADLKAGEVVLDLGSGGGIDVLLSARRVGPAGKAYGLDMTDEMLELARENASKAGVQNVEFLRGEMENIPLPRNSVDVIISNCVVNLSPDKDAVLAEAFRVLKPGGRLAIADIVTKDDLPVAVRESLPLWTGCIAGALTQGDYISKLAAAGFENAEIETFREYTAGDAESGGLGDLVRKYTTDSEAGLGIFSGVVRARKPANVGSRPLLEEIPVLGAEGQACEPGTCC